MKSSLNIHDTVNEIYDDIVNNLLRITPSADDILLIKKSIELGCIIAEESIADSPDKDTVRKLMENVMKSIPRSNICKFEQITLTAQLRIYRQYLSKQ